MFKYSALGIGYAWKPSTINVKVGDEVTIRWTFPSTITDVTIGPFTTSSPTTNKYDGNGFNLPRSHSSKFNIIKNDEPNFTICLGIYASILVVYDVL